MTARIRLWDRILMRGADGVRGCATPMRSWGCPRARARRTSRAPTASSPRSCIPDANKHDPKAATSSPSSSRLRNRRRRRQAQGVRPRRDRRRGQAALPGLRGLWRGGRARRRLRRREGDFESFTLGPEGFQRGGGARRRRPAAVRRLRGHPEGGVRRRAAARRAAARRRRLRVRGRGFGSAPRARHHRVADHHAAGSRARA